MEKINLLLSLRSFIESDTKCFSDCKITAPPKQVSLMSIKGIHADVIGYIFVHLHMTLRTERNMLDTSWLQVAKELVKLNTYGEIFGFLGVISGWQKR